MFSLIFQLGLVIVTAFFAFGWLHVIKQRDEGDRRNAILQDSLMAMSNDFNALHAKYLVALSNIDDDDKVLDSLIQNIDGYEEIDDDST